MPTITEDSLIERSLNRIALFSGLIFLALALALCYFASWVCITIVASGFIAILADPLVVQLERLRLGRVLASGLVTLLGVLIVGLAITAIYQKANDFSDQMPAYSARIRRAFSPVARKFERVKDTAASITPQDSSRKIPEVKVKETSNWTAYLFRGVNSISESLAALAAVPFLSFFMLIKKNHVYSRFATMLENRINVSAFITELNRMVRGFVVGNLIVGSIMAGITCFTFAALGMKNAISLGIVTSILNLIPFLGAVLAVLIACAAALLQFNTPSTFAVIVTVIVLLHLIAANMLVPRVIGSRVSVGPVAVIIGMLFWGWLWGIFGVLLAVPLTAFVKLVADTQPGLIHVSNILAPSPREAKEGRKRVWPQLSVMQKLKRNTR